MALRTKKDNSGYFIGCLGHPACSHVIWLPSIIKEIKLDDGVCAKCGSRKFTMKFRQMSMLAMLNPANIHENVYEACFVCDLSLLSLLDIPGDSVRKSANATARPVPASSTSNRSVATNNRPQNITTSRNTNSNRVAAVPISRPAPPANAQRTNSTHTNTNTNANRNQNANSRPANPTNVWNNFRQNNNGPEDEVKCAVCQQPAKK